MISGVGRHTLSVESSAEVANPERQASGLVDGWKSGIEAYLVHMELEQQKWFWQSKSEWHCWPS